MDATEYRRRLVNDFPFFCQQVFDFRQLNDVHPFGWVEQEILEYASRGPNRAGVLAWREYGKTNLIAINLPLWHLLRDPDFKILVSSRSERSAKDTLDTIKKLITAVPFLQHLRPNISDEKYRWRTTQIDVAGSKESRVPSVAAIGVDGMLEGMRAHLIIADDVETDNNTITLDSRVRLDNRCKEFAAICYKGGKILYLGTYHHEDSLYLRLNDRGYTIKTWPILFPGKDDKCINLSDGILSRIDAGAKSGDIVAPYRITPDYVVLKQAEGSYFFRMQYMLSSNMGDGATYPLRLGDLIVFDFLPEKAPIDIAWGVRDSQNQSTTINDIPFLGFTGDSLRRPILFDAQWEKFQYTRMWIDPSGKGEDKTGYAVVSSLNGYLYVHDVGGLDGGADPADFRKLALIGQKYKINEFVVEEMGMQSAWINFFASEVTKFYLDKGQDPDMSEGWRAPVRGQSVKGQKEMRIIEALDPVMSQHRLVVPTKVIANKSLQYQISRITTLRNCLQHEDELEALAMCVGQFKQQASMRTDIAVERSRQMETEAMYAESMKLKNGGKNPDKRVFTHSYTNGAGYHHPKKRKYAHIFR